MWRLRSLRWRLTLFYAALLLILVAAVGGFVYFQLDRFLVESSASRLSYQTSPKLNFQRPPPRGKNEDYNTALQRFSNQVQQNLVSSDTYAVTFDLQGHLVAPAPANITSAGPPSFQIAAPSSKQFQAALTAKDYSFISDVPGHARAIVLIVPVGERDNSSNPLGGPPDRNPPTNSGAAAAPQVLVVVAQLLTDADQTLGQLRLILGLGLLGAAVLILLLGLPIARLGLRPLNKMTTTAYQIANGDLSRRVALTSPKHADKQDEIQRLNIAFNQMLDQIEASFAAQRRSEARTRQFVADASHELRSPLTTLRGSIEVLLMQAKRDPTQAEKLMLTMRREISRLSRLVVDLLQLTRLDANTATKTSSFQFEPMRLDLLVAQVGEELGVVVGAKHLDFPAILEQNALWIWGDADRLRQVLNNLLDNALRYTAPDGHITVTLTTASEPREEWVQLQVQDDGVGIEPEHLGRIFDRFYRADPARDRATGNAGLGLAIVKAIVEAHAGTITVASQPGSGTTFTVLLPLVPAPQPASIT